MRLKLSPNSSRMAKRFIVGIVEHGADFGAPDRLGSLQIRLYDRSRDTSAVAVQCQASAERDASLARRSLFPRQDLTLYCKRTELETASTRIRKGGPRCEL